MDFEEWMENTFQEPEWDEGWTRADMQAAWQASRENIGSEKVDEKLLLRLIASSAYAAYVNTLSGCNSPAQQFYFERSRKPEIGDLVLEVSSFSRCVKSESLINHIGHLVSIKSEPYPNFEADEDESVPERDIWTIETLDNRLFRWENCDFIVIPTTPQMIIDNERCGSRARQEKKAPDKE